MRKNAIKLILVILTILISSGIVYSQVGYWEPLAPLCKNPMKSIYRLSFTDNNDIWAVTLEGIFYSTNNGNTWIQTTNNGFGMIERKPYFNAPDDGYKYLENIMLAFAVNPISGSIFVSGNGGIFRLSKDEKIWENVLGQLFDPHYFLIGDMVVKASGDIYAIGNGAHPESAGYHSIYYSSDNGDTWIEKTKGLTPKMICSSLALATDGTIYTSGHAPGEYGGTYRLDNGADTWVKILDRSVSYITVSTDGSIFVAADISGVLKSTDKGVTWKEANKGLPLEGYYVDNDGFGHYPYNIAQIIYNPVTNHLFIVDVFSKLFYISTDLGESWNSDITSNFPIGSGFGEIGNLAVNPKTGMVFAYINKVYRLKATSKEDIEFFMSKEKEATVLLENYPNPFNPITSIQYHLGENSLVTLKVYDVMGREIATLINNKMQLKGTYNASFNASGLTSGIYFYTVFANGKPYTQKMLLMK